MVLDYSVDGAVGLITLDRPPANSYDYDFMRELDGAVNSAASDPEIFAVVVRSASDRFFSAGADVKAFAENSATDNMKMIELAHRALAHIATIPKIFVAELAGHALGGGLEIALACDLRFGSDAEYKLGVPEVTLGLLPGNGGTQRLPRLIGPGPALDLLITGRQLSPAEALELGVLDRVFPASDLSRETLDYASRLSSGATKAIGAIKLAVHRGLDGPLEDGLELERRSIERLFSTRDAQEGISAFADKRKPKFVGS